MRVLSSTSNRTQAIDVSVTVSVTWSLVECAVRSVYYAVNPSVASIPSLSNRRYTETNANIIKPFDRLSTQSGVLCILIQFLCAELTTEANVQQIFLTFYQLSDVEPGKREHVQLSFFNVCTLRWISDACMAIVETTRIHCRCQTVMQDWFV
ncbi:hypothetical protein D9M71_588980 [compost metagenome]